MYAITAATYKDPCANLGPGQGCVELADAPVDIIASGQHLNNLGAIVHDYLGPAAYWQNGQNLPIGLLGGHFAKARDINDAGQVVGGTETNPTYVATDVTHQSPYYPFQAFVWQNGNFTNLGGLPGSLDISSEATAINNKGQIVGEAAGHAVLWQNGAITDLDTGKDTGSLAYGINGSGQVVGINGPTAALWDSGHYTDLGALPNQQGSYALAINDKAQVIGSSVPKGADVFVGQSPRAVLWQNGQIQDLGTLGGPTASALGINNAGQIVGQAATAQYTLVSTVGRGLSRRTPAFTTKRVLSRCKAAASSVPAAASTDPIGTARSYIPHAFLWQNGTMTDLNTLIAANTGWVLLAAGGINNKGQIVGVGTYKGAGQIFLLTPK